MSNELTNFRQLVGNRIFSVEFIKKDGTIRQMNCRLGVIKHLQGGELGYDAARLNYVIVYDMQAKGYRTLNISNLLSLTIGQVRYEIADSLIIGETTIY